MVQIGFGTKWGIWVSECLKTTSISVLVNGSPTEEFKALKGIRQSDPLSPFLFLNFAVGINMVIKEAINNGAMKGSQWEEITWWFHIYTSSLEINLSKSKLYEVGVSQDKVEEMARMLKCCPGKLTFMYVGLPIRVNMNNVESWRMLVVKKFKDRLLDWKASLISFGGRLTMVRKLGNAKKTWFWKDKWVGDFKLCDKFQSLFRFKGDEDVSVRNHVRDILLVRDNVESWKWLLTDDEVFSVKGFKEIVTYRVHDMGAHDEETSWCKIMPRKVFSIWKAFEGNTRDLGSFGEETDKITNQHQDSQDLMSQRLETASPFIHDAITLHLVTASQHFLTESADRLNSDLEYSTL
ncbi:hypothetical protein Tco_1447872 [Tanacetum coccineum]